MLLYIWMCEIETFLLTFLFLPFRCFLLCICRFFLKAWPKTHFYQNYKVQLLYKHVTIIDRQCHQVLLSDVRIHWRNKFMEMSTFGHMMLIKSWLLVLVGSIDGGLNLKIAVWSVQYFPFKRYFSAFLYYMHRLNKKTK